jgi:hypothetical protein
MGATPMTSTKRDIMMAAAWPSLRSRTMAREITMPADAPNAATERKMARIARLGASAQPIVLRVKTIKPAISGMRRPKRSDSVPWVIWPMARPANHVARVSCAVPGAVPKVASTAGNPGRYMSVAAGPTAMNRPRRFGNQVGCLGGTRLLILGCLRVGVEGRCPRVFLFAPRGAGN